MPTQFDNGWTALTNPGKAIHYFNMDYPKIQLDTSVYSNSNALWLAELSRLIYRKDKNKQNKPITPTRSEILNQVALQETHWFSRGNIHCAIIEPLEHVADKFAVLVFRGTQERRNWLTNLNTLLTRWSGEGSVHSGFNNALANVWEEVEAHLSSLNVPVFYTGHSLGAALATLAAAKKPPHALYTFGSPRVGNAEFKKIFENIRSYRIVNHRDLTTTVPLTTLGFCHVGQLHYITHDGTLLVEPSQDTVSTDRKQTDTTWQDNISSPRWLNPPEYLFDHSPVNYVAHLERQL